MILDTYGSLLWNEPTKYGKSWALDVMQFKNEPHLVFWASKDPLNSTYDEVQEIKPSPGWVSDDHDFDLTPDETAILVVNKDIPFDLSPVGGPRHGWLRDNGIQEIDVTTGELLFHWEISKHYDLEESYHAFTPGWAEDPEHPFEPFVLNSAQADANGNYLVSSRHLSSIAYVDGKTGELLWKLGGKKNEFTDLSPGMKRNATFFNGQHHARIIDNESNDETIVMTIFDNGFGAQEESHRTTGKIVRLNVKRMTAELLHEPCQNQDQPLSTESRGSMQILPNGDRLIGYGIVPSWAEFAPDGRLLCDVHYAPEVGFNTQEAFSYRVLRRPWVGKPRHGPSVVTDDKGLVHVSWNGATEVVSWELQSHEELSNDLNDEPAGSFGMTKRTGFETTLHLPNAPGARYLKVAARNYKGELLGVSEPFPNIGAAPGLTAKSDLRKDVAPERTDLMVGVYQDDEGNVYTLPAVIEARRALFAEPNWHHGYRPSQIGSTTFLHACTSLFFGKDSIIVEQRRVAATQCLGASGACYMAACLLKKHHVTSPTVFMPRETWSNHANIFEHAGLQVHELPYFDARNGDVDYDSLLSAANRIPPESVLVLQTAGQNPTGCDLTNEQWSQLAGTCATRGHLIIFDAAYYGMAKANVPVILAATFSKALGLYSERVGVLCVTAPDSEICHRLEMQLRLMTRYETGGYPAFGANIVELILTSPDLRAQWEADVKTMASQLQDRRKRLRALLEELQTPGNWESITNQKGMFCLMSLTHHELKMLRKVHHVYLQDNGRLSISGITNANIEHVAKSIDSVIRASSQVANGNGGH
ncbi:hypothetical protein CBER1_10595 [Cercospora berteroae]|uniref:Aminotransferase class I/classII large domain-containing protein n=1 Tax=Cercospora berteroae TaxID=357750 RepID=A0A2S6BYV0_9PEZI|nr:hypothetical protein CBER1_10595 [Cercospora berteroae]